MKHKIREIKNRYTIRIPKICRKWIRQRQEIKEENFAELRKNTVCKLYSLFKHNKLMNREKHISFNAIFPKMN